LLQHSDIESDQAPNGVVSHVNLVAAVEAEHLDSVCIKKPDLKLHAIDVSNSVRVLLSKFRDVKRDNRIIAQKVLRVSDYH